MIKIAKKLDPKGIYCHIEDRDFSQLTADIYDLVLSAFTFDNIPTMKKKVILFRELRKLLKKDGKILINTIKKPKDFDFSKKYAVSTVDATGVALKHEILVGGIPVVNTPILGAIPKILDRVTLKSIQETVKGKWKGEVAALSQTSPSFGTVRKWASVF